MYDILDKLGVKNMSDLTKKETKGIYNTRTPTFEQIRRYKRFGKEFIDGLTGNIRKDVTVKIIQDCRTSAAIEFRSKLGLKQPDIIMTKEQSILTKIMKAFTSAKILLQHSVLSYKFNLYLPKHKLAIEFDEKGHKARNIDYEKTKSNRRRT